MNVGRPVWQKYLAREAERASCEAAALVPGTYGHALCVPACGEGDELLRAIASVPAGPLGPVLVVTVVNARDDAPAWAHERNASLGGRLARAYGAPSLLGAAGELALYQAPFGVLITFDRASPSRRLPPGQGVGLARKLGLDLALALFADGRLASRYLHTTDADVVLPADYFARAGNPGDAPSAALVYPFEHDASSADDDEAAGACARYEMFLRYYVLGLASAGSPYAFHTIGSTLALDAGAYALVRGVPRRTAAEDFYLLSKIAKVGAVTSLAGAPLRLSARRSARTPFGTGRAIDRITARAPAAYTVYPPVVFAYLAAWSAAAQSFVRAPGPKPEGVLARACVAASLDPGPALTALARLGAFSALATFSALPRPGRAFDVWFDAFRTRAFVHALRDGATPAVSLPEALASAPFLPDPRPSCEPFDVGAWRAFLAERERALPPRRGVDADGQRPNGPRQIGARRANP